MCPPGLFRRLAEKVVAVRGKGVVGHERDRVTERHPQTATGAT